MAAAADSLRIIQKILGLDEVKDGWFRAIQQCVKIWSVDDLFLDKAAVRFSVLWIPLA